MRGFFASLRMTDFPQALPRQATSALLPSAQLEDLAKSFLQEQKRTMRLLPPPVGLRRVGLLCLTLILSGPLCFAASARAAEPPASDAVNLAAAVLVLPPGMSGPEKQAAVMLVEEAEKRSQLRWPTSDRLPEGGKPAVVLGQRAALVRAFPALADRLKTGGNAKPEGYQILTFAPGLVIVAGNDARGVLYGAGRLLRLMDYSREGVAVAAGIDVATAPKFPLRGHQLGYRPKTNAYDAWDAAQWEQYIRDLVIFGANAIEGIPPRSDDAADSPHFPLSQIRMLAEQSRIAHTYGIEFWIWYPAIDRNYSDPATVTFALKEWADVLKQLPHVDALFVPGGDPGHTPPKLLFPMLEQQTAQLQKLHPGAKMWMSPQGFSTEWMTDFYDILKQEPTWLEGIVFGPQQRESLDDLRARVPKRFKMRFYPDITHSIGAQYPVTGWDIAFAATENRETINPRPVDEAAIFRRIQPLAEQGVLTYSEGCNDDVNKCIWTSLAWDPDADVTGILRDYSRYFIGASAAEGFAQGLLALERNWRGPLLSNTSVYTTLAQFQEMERTAPPSRLANWRFQMGLYRAYYDATDRARLLAETVQEATATEHLRSARTMGSIAAMSAAEAALEIPAVRPAADWRARTFELAEALFQSIRMQLSVSRYRAIAVGRGANLDLIDAPLTDAPWLKAQFQEIRALPNEPDRLRRIDEIVNWTNPGPGGFYDDLGNATAQPHLVRNATYAQDPAALKTPMNGFGLRRQGPPQRVSSARFVETLFEQPLEMQYKNLDRTAHYKVRIMYGMEARGSIRLVANGKIEIHPLRPKEPQTRPLEFDLPAEATAGGELRLTWSGATGLGGAGRGVQVAEVWLVRVP